MLRELGVRHGDRVALIAENDPRVFEIQFICMRLGALFVPLNWRLHVNELHEICHDAKPVVLIHDGQWAQAAEVLAEKATITHRMAWNDSGAIRDYESALAAATPLPPMGTTLLDDPTHILYTSGTTGRPKGALSTNETMVWQAMNTAHTTGHSQPGCHQLNQMPLFHAGGLQVMANSILYFGGAVTTITRFVPDVVLGHLINSDPPITHVAAIPLMYQAIADVPGFDEADLSNLRHLVVAGAIATPELLQLWADRGVPLQPQYGGTEMGPMGTGLDDEAVNLDKAKKGSTGRKAMHTEIRLVDATGADVDDGVTGEIWLRGPSVTIGYWRQDRSQYFTEDGWFRTGDAAHRDAEGFYYPDGRTKDMFKSGGENIYPAEVENVLSLHPAVRDVGVVGITDAKWGEVGLAVVVAEPGAMPTLEDLNHFATERLARYKLPKKLVLVDHLPRNVTGKLSREQLRADHSDL